MYSSDNKNNLAFLVVAISFSLGFGAFDRLPYLLYTYSGTPFLLIYFIATMFLTTPILLMEMYLGSPITQKKSFNLTTLLPKHWHITIIPVTLVPVGILIYFLVAPFMPILYSVLSLNLFDHMTNGEFLNTENYNKFDVFLSNNLEHNFSDHFLITSGLLIVSTILLIDKGIIWRLVSSGLVLLISVCVLLLLLITNSIYDGSVEYSIRTMLSFSFSGFGFNVLSFNCVVDAIYYAFFTVGAGTGILIAVSYKFSLSHRNLFKDILTICICTFVIGLVIAYTIIAMLHKIGEAPSEIGIKSLFIYLPNYFYEVEDGQLLSVVFYGIIGWCYFYTLMLILISIFTNLKVNYKMSIYHRFIIFMVFVCLDIIVSNININADLLITYLSYIYKYFYRIILPISLISISIITGYILQVQTYRAIYRAIVLEDRYYRRRIVSSVLFTVRVLIPIVGCFLLIVSILVW